MRIENTLRLKKSKFMIQILKILISCSKKIRYTLFKHASTSNYQDLKKITYNNAKAEKKLKKGVKNTQDTHKNQKKSTIVYEKENVQKYLPKYASLEKYTLIEKMGDGAHSEVYKAICNESKEYVAIKVIRKYQLNYTQKVNVFKEIRIMQDIDHPNIVRFLGFLENNDYYFLILELVEGGEIFHQIVRLTYFSEDLSRHIITQVANAIRHLHEEKGVVHRDIKPENILFKPIPFIPSKYPKSKDANKDEGEFIQEIGSGSIGQVKIADFGLSKVIWDRQTKTPCGTIGYTAPEIIKDQKYSKCVDMWALGCVLYTFLCGFPPFYDENVHELSRKVVQGEYAFISPWWDGISKSAQDLISNLLTVDPKKRYTIDQFLNHPWIRGLDKKDQLDNVSHVSNSLTLNSSFPSAEIRNSPIFKGFQKDSRSPGILPLRDAFDISYTVQRIKEENTYQTPRLLQNTMKSTENISYYIEEAIQKNLYPQMYHTIKENIYTTKHSKNKNQKHIERNYSIHSTCSSVQSLTDHSSRESYFELFLEKSTLLCRRKALIAIDV